LKTILDDIVAKVRLRLAEKERLKPLVEIVRTAAAQPTPRDFAGALRGARFALISEIKKASPAKGWLHEELDILKQAKMYEQGGASAVSVLTEPDYFKGSLEDLKSVRAAVKLPVLRKDFILGRYQVYEARLYGADAVLLIVSLLAPDTLRDLISLAHEMKMSALVEVHDEAETKTALTAGARIIGINNRNLADFTVDLGTSLKLRPLVPPEITVISESGIATKEDVSRLKGAGINGILVGEALVKAENPEAKIRELLGRAKESRIQNPVASSQNL